MNRALCALIVTFALARAGGAEDCAFAPIADGYGANGPYAVVRDSFEVTGEGGARSDVYVFLPGDTLTKCPVTFFLHKFGDTGPEEYHGLIEHIVSRGHVVVYPPLDRITFTRKHIKNYQIAFSAFDDALRRHASRVDSTRIGFVGHGFGGGAVPSLARKALIHKKWGTNGLFMYIMAPWYTFGIDQRQLQSFPAQAKFVVQVFADDNINDPRIALDVFRNISIPDSCKEFLMVFSDTRGRCRLRADNTTPLSAPSFWGVDDALDYYGIYRVYDALADFTFTGTSQAAELVFGTKPAHELSLGTWTDGISVRPMVASADPKVYFPGQPYINTWLSARNPRVDVSRFRKARRMFANKYRRKWQTYGTHIKNSLKAKVGDNSDFDIMENPIVEGYGADGSYTVVADSFPSPLNPNQPIHFFRPKGLEGTLPLVIFVHGYIGQEPSMFEPFLSHVVSRGFAVLYPTYPFFPSADDSATVMQKYEFVFAGIDAAAKRYADIIDTTRVGFFGQSFGAGAVPAVTWHYVAKRNWGTAGAYMFISAPWYVYGISQEQLENFPKQVKMIVQVYEDDRINDHHLAVDLFNSIGIPTSDKEYITLFSDEFEGYAMHADHFVPYGIGNIHATEDLLLYYGVYRFFDALADCALTAGSTAREVALGNGSEAQRFMGYWAEDVPVKQCDVTDSPRVLHEEFRYMWAWGLGLNPRRER